MNVKPGDIIRWTLRMTARNPPLEHTRIVMVISMGAESMVKHADNRTAFVWELGGNSFYETVFYFGFDTFEVLT